MLFSGRHDDFLIPFTEDDNYRPFGKHHLRFLQQSFFNRVLLFETLQS